MSRQIPLYQGGYAIVDASDYDTLALYRWHLRGNGYAYLRLRLGGGKEKQVAMHRIILNAPSDLVVDHINGNKLDNRRENLRLATRIQNNRYRTKTRHDSRSRFKGVHLDKRDGWWYVYITVNYKKISAGRYATEEAAARAYDRLAIEYHGEFAALNFPSARTEATPLPPALTDDFAATCRAVLTCNLPPDIADEVRRVLRRYEAERPDDPIPPPRSVEVN